MKINFEELMGQSTGKNSPPESMFKEGSTKYVITGKDRSGKRFAPIHTNTPQHYNIWQGTLWEIQEGGKRKKVKEYTNGFSF